jgi:hypothetical protein
LRACCVLSWVLVVRCGPRGDRSGRTHLHERDKQHDAAFDQAHHARAGDGDSCGRWARGSGDWGSHCRLGGESFRPQMVARHRRGFRTPRSPGRSPDDGETCGCAARHILDACSRQRREISTLLNGHDDLFRRRDRGSGVS